MKNISIKNFNKYQHYHTKTITSWIKLYFSILDDYKFSTINDEQKWLFVGLILLAPKLNNSIPFDCNYIKQSLKLSSNYVKENIELLMKLGFVVESSDIEEQEEPIEVTCLNYFYTEYERIRKNKYIKNFKDIYVFKNLNYLMDFEIKSLIDYFLKSKDEFIIKSGYTIPIFNSQINKMVELGINKNGKHNIDTKTAMKELSEKTGVII